MAITFGASNNKVDIPYTVALNPAQFSFSLWAKPTGGAGTYRSPVTSRDDLPQRGYILYASDVNRWSFWIGNGSTWVQLNGPAVVLDTWTHIACTYDGATMRMYVNGVGIGTTAAASLSPNTVRPLRIGAGATEGSGGLWFPGQIDDVRVYSRVLSATEALFLFTRRGSDEDVYGAVSRWKLLEGYPTQVASGAGVVKDHAGDNDGTPVTSPTWAESGIAGRRKRRAS